MRRRDFLITSLLMPRLRAGLPRRSAQDRTGAKVGAADEWRTFQITTRIDLWDSPGAAGVWIPLPASASSYQRESRDTRSGTAVCQVVVNAGVRMLVADWPEPVRERRLEVISVVSTRNRRVDLQAAHQPPGQKPDPRYLQPTTLIPSTASSATLRRRTAAPKFSFARSDGSRSIPRTSPRSVSKNARTARSTIRICGGRGSSSSAGGR